MSNKFDITRYIYTQDPTDKDRGIAWTKFVLNYIVNGDNNDNNGSTDAVINRINNVFNKPIPNNKNLTVGQSFGFDANTKTGNETFNNFVTLWSAYILAITSGNLANNKYALNLHRNVFGPKFNSYDSAVKRILNAVFYVGGDNIPPLDAPFDVDSHQTNPSLNQNIDPSEYANNKIHVNIPLLFSFLGNNFVTNLDNQINNNNDLSYIEVYELATRKLENKQTFWPNLKPGKYFTNIFAKLADINYRSKNLGKYDYNANDLEHDKYIQYNLWKKHKLDDGTIFYLKDNQPIDVDDPNFGVNVNCYNLGVNASVCKNFIDIILLNSSDEAASELANFIRSNGDAFGDIKNTINNVHPEIALIVLKRFGFKVNKNNEIISVGDWLKKFVSKYFKNAELEAIIRKNDKLLDFLDYLVRFVNYNPHILDPNVQTRFEYNAMKDFYYVNVDADDLEKNLKYHKINKLSHRGFKKINPLVFGDLMKSNMGYNVLFGGAHDNEDQANYFDEDAVFPSYTHGHKLMEMYFNNLKGELNKYGKRLNPKDEQIIQNQIESLKYYEEDILKKLTAIGEFAVNNNKKGKVQITNDRDINKIMNMKKFNLAKENYSYQEDQVVNSLLMLLGKFKKGDNIQIPIN